METPTVLDIIERLLGAAEHPDVVSIERYGPGQGPWGPTVEQSKAKAITGIYVVHQSTATASVWEAVWPGGHPIPAPAVAPPPRQNRAPRLLLLVAALLDVAKPAQLTSWQLMKLPNLGLEVEQAHLPFGLGIVTAAGEKVLLRATATGPTLGTDPLDEPFPDYEIPEGVKTCLLGSSTPKTNQPRPADAALAARS